MAQQRLRSARVLTVLNLKGGVGKTHAAWLLAGVCQERGRRILLVDVDVQANLTGSFLEDEQRGPGVERLFDPAHDTDVAPLIRRTAFDQIDLLPACPSLARFDAADRASWQQSDLHLALVEPLGGLRQQYDFIVVDCPPRLSVVSYAALCASDYIIIPLESADWGAQGIRQATAAAHEVEQRFNPRLQLLGYLVSRFKRARAYQQSYLTELRAHFGALAFDTVIPDLARFEQSVTDRIPITLHSPRSDEAGIARAFFREVERRIQGHAGRRPASRTQRVRRTAALAG